MVFFSSCNTLNFVTKHPYCSFSRVGQSLCALYGLLNQTLDLNLNVLSVKAQQDTHQSYFRKLIINCFWNTSWYIRMISSIHYSMNTMSIDQQPSHNGNKEYNGSCNWILGPMFSGSKFFFSSMNLDSDFPCSKVLQITFSCLITNRTI
jgi:hypothetical protein